MIRTTALTVIVGLTFLLALAPRSRSKVKLATVVKPTTVRQTAETFRFIPGGNALGIPFEFNGNLILVHIRVNGSAPLTFILDTGSELSIISKGRAESLGLIRAHNETANGQAPAGTEIRGASFKLPGLEITNVVTVALPLDSFEPRLGQRIDGVLGGNCLTGVVAEIDYTARRLRLHDPRTYRYVGTGQVIPISIDGNSPIVDVKVVQSRFAPVDVKLLLDTGFRGAVSFERGFAEAHRFLVPPKSVSSSGTTLYGGDHELVGRLTQLQVGQFVVRNALARFSLSEDEPADSALAGTIGGEFLRRFDMVLDYAHAQLILRPNAHFADPDDTNMNGMAIVAGGRDFKEYKVQGVLSNSPASESGFRSGDLLIAINGKPAGNFSVEQLRQLFRQQGRTLYIEVARGKEKLKLRLTLRRII